MTMARTSAALGMFIVCLAGMADIAGAAGPANAAASTSFPAASAPAPSAVASAASDATAQTTAGTWAHAYAAFGQPKYPAGFDHFEYAEPSAPKGGTLFLANPDRRTSFDKFNYYTLKGNAPAGVPIFMSESLTTLSADEPMTMYGLLAESMLVAPDKSSITFRINPKARFSNGDPVLAEDVKYSFDSLSGKYASPTYATTFATVKRLVVVDERTVRFESADKSSDTLFKAGDMPVFSHKWGFKADGTHTRFDEMVAEFPLMSGPYTIAVADGGRRIEFKRNPDYWAKDLGARRGLFNFDRIVYRYYKDYDIAAEAFKAGEFDIVKVYSPASWVRKYRGEKWDDGRIVKQTLQLGTGEGLQSYEINTRRPLFKDIRVREALNLTYDLENNNRYHRLKRANSIFNNSQFAAQGSPSPGELKLLEPYRSQLPATVFGPAYVAPRNDTDPNALRRNLLKARSLLEAAGWKLAPDNVLRNDKGEAFSFEYLDSSEGNSEAQLSPWRRNLGKLGIMLRDRPVDYALFNRRLEEYDFDMVTIAWGSFTLPSPSDFEAIYGSKSADEKGNNNLRGIKSPAVDHVIDAMNHAATLEDFRDACRALDRIVMWNYWQVPQVYGDFDDVSYWNKFDMPKVLPKFFTIDAPPDVDPTMRWPLLTWWIKDPKQR